MWAVDLSVSVVAATCCRSVGARSWAFSKPPHRVARCVTSSPRFADFVDVQRSADLLSGVTPPTSTFHYRVTWLVFRAPRWPGMCLIGSSHNLLSRRIIILYLFASHYLLFPPFLCELHLKHCAWAVNRRRGHRCIPINLDSMFRKI